MRKGKEERRVVGGWVGERAEARTLDAVLREGEGRIRRHGAEELGRRWSGEEGCAALSGLVWLPCGKGKTRRGPRTREVAPIL